MGGIFNESWNPSHDFLRVLFHGTDTYKITPCMSCQVSSLRENVDQESFVQTREGSRCPFPHWAYVVKPPALSDVGITALLLYHGAAHSSKSLDELMRDEKRQQCFSFSPLSFLPKTSTTWDLFPPNINNTLKH